MVEVKFKIMIQCIECGNNLSNDLEIIFSENNEFILKAEVCKYCIDELKHGK